MNSNTQNDNLKKGQQSTSSAKGGSSAQHAASGASANKIQNTAKNLNK